MGCKFYQQYHEVDLMLENADKELSRIRSPWMPRIKNGGGREDHHERV